MKFWRMFPILFCVASADAATIVAGSACRDDVNAAILAAADGDTVQVPNGSCVWTSGITLTKGISIIGQTTTNPAAGTANDQTILVDNLADVPGGQGFFHCTTNTGQSLRISGLTFTGQGGSSVSRYNGALRFSGTSNQVRLDHCHFHSLHIFPTIGWYDSHWGVIDHCVKDDSVTGNEGFVHVVGDNNGDDAFRVPAGFGGPNFLFLEDNYMNGGCDLTAGGKMVVRNCIIVGNNSLGMHGTGRTNPSFRGGRAYEVYNTQFRYSNNYSSIDGPDGGSAIYHDNTVSPHTNGCAFQVYRVFYSFGSPFFGANGSNNWDYNVTEADGTHVNGHSPYLFASGTLTGGTSGDTLADSSKSWSTNQWTDYQVKRTSDGATALIQSNTATTLTVFQWNSQGFASGQGYQIHKVLRVLDQPGLGAGNAINRASPAWPNPANEPMYSWNNRNTDDNSNWGFVPASGNATVLAGRDYFNNTTMPGYTPYDYPHPLVGNSTPSPTPTATATATASPTLTPTPTPTATPPFTSAGIQEVGNGSQRATVAASGADMAVKAFAGDVTAGNEIVVAGAAWALSAAITTVAITDSRSTSYTVVLGTDQNDGGHFRTFIARGFPVTSGPCIVTVNPAGTSADFSWSQDEFLGVNPSVSYNGTDVQGTMVASTAGTATNSHLSLADALIIGVLTHGNQTVALSPGDGHVTFGKIENNSGGQAHIAIFRIEPAPNALEFAPHIVNYAAGAASNHPWTFQTYGFGKANTPFDITDPAIPFSNSSSAFQTPWRP